ncbi:hypothetical protein [Nocardia abscessus]|uniref:hypothetical protein n=1 Tax=Nocardia abscessus TaxID=120957 RepID=UPI0024541CFD|nr:hypothetical protein [Nocardia abscessus]
MADTAVPQLWTEDLAGTLDFYKTLGYSVTHEQIRPYVYGAVEDPGRAEQFRAELRAMRLSPRERASVADELRASDDLTTWLSE